MKRLLAVLALLAGGLANEVAHPLSCLLTTATRRERIEPNGKRRAGRARGPTARSGV
jgi:hypothetical protein